MKFLCLVLLVSFQAFAQDIASQLSFLDSKIYSLKTKGVSDFVVDIESSRLTKEVNDQMVFGNVKELIFRTFWTANPERLAIEVIGLPEGFKEVKEELKSQILSIMENILPLPTKAKFSGYKFSPGPKLKEYIVQDTTGIASIPSYLLRYDGQDKLIEIVGNKPVGTLKVNFKYTTESFADGKFVLDSSETFFSENGQTLITKKNYNYGKSQGIGVLQELEIETEQKLEGQKAKSLKLKETVKFNNYKINSGDGLKYFLSEGSKTTP